LERSGQLISNNGKTKGEGMIIILGDSCAGKTSLERMLVEKGFHRIISYTSRPIRNGETDHIDYHFLTEGQFLEKMSKGFFAECTTYNSWHYGIAKEDMLKDAIAVVEPVGARQIKKWSKENNVQNVFFYIKVPERERVVRMMNRGDNVMESFRRIISDQGTFNGIGAEVDYVVENEFLPIALHEILNILWVNHGIGKEVK